MLDLDALSRIIESSYVRLVVEEHGESAEALLQSVLSSVRNLFRYIDIEKQNRKIVVFKTLVDSDRPITAEPTAQKRAFPELLGLLNSHFALQVLDSGEIVLWNTDVDVAYLSGFAIVYCHENNADYFHVNGKVRLVEKVDPSYPSNFAVPVYNNLDSALDVYRVRMVKTSTCRILNLIWDDPNRLVSKSGPEDDIRDSLTQFLRSHLGGDVEVDPEHNTGLSNPVDIRVTWWQTNRLALIEIKWLGTPRKPNGDLGKMYTDYRAREGAAQLAEYLENKKHESPDLYVQGYYVIVDFRRKGLKKDSKTLSRAEGFHYEFRDITFSPEYHKIRNDFSPPIRMFVEPQIV